MYIVWLSTIRNGRFISATLHEYDTLDEALYLAAKAPPPFYAAITDEDGCIYLPEMSGAQLTTDNIHQYLEINSCLSVS